MTDQTAAGNRLLDAWLSLTSVLWNTRIVHSMTYNEAHVLGILLRHCQEKVLTATDLIRSTHMLKSQMNKLLTSLEHKGFVRRARSAQDKRRIEIHLTAEGRIAYLQEHQGVEALLSKLIDRLGMEKTHSVASQLNEVVAALEDILA